MGLNKGRQHTGSGRFRARGCHAASATTGLDGGGEAHPGCESFSPPLQLPSVTSCEHTPKAPRTRPPPRNQGLPSSAFGEGGRWPAGSQLGAPPEVPPAAPRRSKAEAGEGATPPARCALGSRLRHFLPASGRGLASPRKRKLQGPSNGNKSGGERARARRGTPGAPPRVGGEPGRVGSWPRAARRGAGRGGPPGGTALAAGAGRGPEPGSAGRAAAGRKT